MDEQFSGDFRLNKTNQNTQSNLKATEDEFPHLNSGELFDFNAEDKFSTILKKNKVESEYLTLSKFEKESARAKQLEKEIAQIKNFENPTRDYFNF